MAKTIQSIVERAKALMKKTEPRSITPTEVGQLHVDTLENVDQNASDIITVAKATGTLMANISDLSLKKVDKIGSTKSLKQLFKSKATQFVAVYSTQSVNISKIDTISIVDGKLRLTAGTNVWNGHGISVPRYRDVTIEVAHKYALIISCQTSKSGMSLMAMHSGNGNNYAVGGADLVELNASSMTRYLWIGKLYTQNETYSTSIFFKNMVDGDYIDVSEVQLIDMTATWGYGSEPQTEAEYLALMGVTSVDELPYIPYSDGGVTLDNGSMVGGSMSVGGNLATMGSLYLGGWQLKVVDNALIVVDANGNETTLINGTSLTDATE